MSLTEEIVQLLSRNDDGTLEFPDPSIPRLIALVGGPEGQDAVDTARALVRVAQFLDEQKGAPRAAATLMTLAAAMAEDAVDAASAGNAAAADKVQSAHRGFAAFSGERTLTSLGDRTRPEGTIPAGPGARFTSVPGRNKT